MNEKIALDCIEDVLLHQETVTLEVNFTGDRCNSKGFYELQWILKNKQKATLRNHQTMTMIINSASFSKIRY